LDAIINDKYEIKIKILNYVRNQFANKINRFVSLESVAFKSILASRLISDSRPNLAIFDLNLRDHDWREINDVFTTSRLYITESYRKSSRETIADAHLVDAVF